MTETTTVQLDKKIVNNLKKLKDHPRQSYNELINKLIEGHVKIKMKNQYDEFLHKIQQEKMNELWNNKEDEVWDDV
jgi:hypothetical protein